MKTILEEQQYAVLKPLCLVADYKVGDEKQYIIKLSYLFKI
ncbi:MAG: hypothetical protein PUB76_06915 [Oscillospiraceae bacterium]|nr:hypothetical protein [Oscillospiraceae bacterium]MDY3257569.1 hypothetical protein [Ruminococcus callidus]